MAAMTDDTALMRIGDLARRSGVPVRTIRFYADAGLVPEAARSESGYRLFDTDALARLGLVRTLRELGVDLAAIARVLAREATLAHVAATHAAALDAQIRALQVQRGVLRAVVDRPTDPQELQLMHRLASLSHAERQRIVDEFLEATFSGLDADPTVLERMRVVEPRLPDDPSPEQVQAWIELAELLQDAEFRATVRAMAERSAAARTADGGQPGSTPATAQVVAERAGGALRAGIEPGSPEGRAIADELAGVLGLSGDRGAEADRIAAFTDRRAERYWQLLGVINGWPPVPSVVPAWEWLVAALRASA
jgi:DNA-binding transcriptional MerR regulator